MQIPQNLFGPPGSGRRGYPSVWRNPQAPANIGNWIRANTPAQFGSAPQLGQMGGVAAPTGRAWGGTGTYLPLAVKQAPPVYNPSGYGMDAGAVTPAMNWADAQARMNLGAMPDFQAAGAGGPGRFQVPRLGTAGLLQQAMQATEPQYVEAPQSIKDLGEAQWYKDFQKEHGGQIPEQYYGAQGAGPSQALAQAIDDLEWSRAFERAEGVGPSDEDWRLHWYATRGGGDWSTRLSPEEWRTKKARMASKWRKKSRVEAGEQPAGTKMGNWWWKEFEGKSPMKWGDFKEMDDEKRDAYVGWWREWGKAEAADGEAAPVTWEEWTEYDAQEQGLVRTWAEHWGGEDDPPLTVDDWLGLSGKDRSDVYGWWQTWGYKDNPPVRWREWLEMDDQKRNRLYETAGRTTEAEVPKFYPPTTYWKI